MAVPALTPPGRPVGRRPKREGRCGSRNPGSRAHPTCSSYLQSALGVPSLHSTSILLKGKIRQWRERHMSRRRASKQPKKDCDSLETKFKKDFLISLFKEDTGEVSLRFIFQSRNVFLKCQNEINSNEIISKRSPQEVIMRTKFYSKLNYTPKCSDYVNCEENLCNNI